MSLVCAVLAFDRGFPELKLASGDELVVRVKGEMNEENFLSACNYLKDISDKGVLITMLVEGAINVMVLALGGVADRVVAGFDTSLKSYRPSTHRIGDMVCVLVTGLICRAQSMQSLGVENQGHPWADVTADLDQWMEMQSGGALPKSDVAA